MSTMLSDTQVEKIEAIIGQAAAFSEYNPDTDDAFRLIVSLAQELLGMDSESVVDTED